MERKDSGFCFGLLGELVGDFDQVWWFGRKRF